MSKRKMHTEVKDDLTVKTDISESLERKMSLQREKESKMVWGKLPNDKTTKTWVLVSKRNNNNRFLAEKEKEMMKI